MHGEASIRGLFWKETGDKMEIIYQNIPNLSGTLNLDPKKVLK